MKNRSRISNITQVQKHITRFKWFYLAGLLAIIGLVIFLSVYFTVIKKESSYVSPNIPPRTSSVPTTTPTPSPTPTPTPAPGGIVQVQEWGGWATTTKDSEPPLWPGAGTPLSFDLQKILNHGNGNKIGTIKVAASGEVIDVIGTMGTAIPWALFSRIFGFKTRTEFIATVIDSCAGRNNIPCCILVQPINKYPDEIASLPATSTNSAFPMVNNLCTKSADCMSINDPKITATYNSGTKYPAYLLVPFQGCGGDCSTSFPDCFNSCPDVQNVVANLNYYTQCKQTPANGCQQIKWLSDNNWIMTPEIEQQFYSNKDAYFAISEQSSNGRNMIAAASSSPNNGHINYCSGKNMHFDVQLLNGANPYWCNLATSADLNNSISLPSNGSSTRGGAIDNTIVRYMLVPGNIFGNFNIIADGDNPPQYPLPTPGCGGSSGGSNRCGTGDWSKSICTNPTCSQTSDCTKLGQGFIDCYAASGCK